MSKDSFSARAVALAALNSIEKDQAFSGLALQAGAKKQPLPPREERLVWRLVYGVTTYRLSLDYILNQFCRREVATLSPTLRNILRLACYQLVYLDRIPDFAAVNEAVDMTRKHAGKGMSGFVNGVLRNVLRNQDGLFQKLKPGSIQQISVLTSHPEWIVKMWVKRWGLEFTAQVCEANNRPVPLTIMVNTGKISVDEYLDLAQENGLAGRAGKYHPHALVFPPDTPFAQLPGFKQGLFMVQGEASMLPVACLELESGHHVLDMCSAPGGKTIQIARIAEKVTACDLHGFRLKLVRENAARMGMLNIETITADAAHLNQHISTKFDRILLDAPCTGFGVIRKKPDIKWTREPKDIKELADLQLKMLQTACEMLNPGGILVYSTCTMSEPENEGVVRKILERSDIHAVGIDIPGIESSNGQISTFPHKDDMDGFFIAKLTKVV